MTKADLMKPKTRKRYITHDGVFVVGNIRLIHLQYFPWTRVNSGQTEPSRNTLRVWNCHKTKSTGCDNMYSCQPSWTMSLTLGTGLSYCNGKWHIAGIALYTMWLLGILYADRKEKKGCSLLSCRLPTVESSLEVWSHKEKGANWYRSADAIQRWFSHHDSNGGFSAWKNRRRSSRDPVVFSKQLPCNIIQVFIIYSK